MKIECKLELTVCYDSITEGRDADLLAMKGDILRRLKDSSDLPPMRLLSCAVEPMQSSIGSFIKVTSSNIEEVCYVEDSEDLFIRFKGGGTYQYFSVSKEEYVSLMESPSKGKYFNSKIKPTYLCEKLG